LTLTFGSVLSFLINNNYLIHYYFSGKARLLFSSELITELESTITKPKLKKYFKTKSLEEMLLAFEPFIDLINVQSIATICRDPKRQLFTCSC